MGVSESRARGSLSTLPDFAQLDLAAARKGNKGPTTATFT